MNPLKRFAQWVFRRRKKKPPYCMFKVDLVIATMPINKRHIVPILHKRKAK